MGSLGDLVLSVTREETSCRDKHTNIIDFVESPWGLGRMMFPVQKVILKALYGIKLDERNKTVCITDWKRVNERKFTEAEYLKYLYDDGRANIDTVLEGNEYNEMILPIGRRSGKTELASWIIAFETDKLLLKDNPQQYYGITQGDEIKLCVVATSKIQASELYNKSKYYFLSCQRFDPYLAGMTGSYTKFQTKSDIVSYGRWGSADNPKTSIKTTFYSCIAKGVRGPGHIIIVLDEFAHFLKKGQSSSEDVYTSIAPSVSAFSQKDPLNTMIPIGPSEGKIIMISSPLGMDDIFYKKFRQGFDNPDLGLCIQAPTWEVNPTIPASEFERRFLTNTDKFYVEFGAEFTTRSKGWIERRSDLVSCVDRKLVAVNRAVKKVPHYMGIDIGVTKGGDGTAIAIGHIENNRVILDVIDEMIAGVGKYAEYDRLKFDDIAEWIHEYTKRFRIEEGILDQWAGIPMEQNLTKRGLKQIKFKAFSQADTTIMFKTMKDMMWDDSLRLYNWDPDHGPLDPDIDLCGYLEELLTLQEEKVSRNISDIKAPRGEHDDRSYALSRMIWLASHKIGNNKYIANSTDSSDKRVIRDRVRTNVRNVRTNVRNYGRSGLDFRR